MDLAWPIQLSRPPMPRKTVPSGAQTAGAPTISLAMDTLVALFYLPMPRGVDARIQNLPP